MRTKAIAAAAVGLFFIGIAHATGVTVPFVGCPSDGQMGAVPAPKGKPFPVPLDARTASQLAYYQSRNYGGVLAPRGWHCANLYGSNGWILLIAPEPLDPAELLDPRKHPLKGPAIQFTMREGGTSGRFEVAQLIARYFPERRAFLERVIAEKIEPASDFPSGPFGTDKLISRGKNIVEYLTPSGEDGLGTMSRLVRSDLPIQSFAAVTGGKEEDWAGYVFAVRLPPAMVGLAPVILREAERHYTTEK